MVIGTDVGEIRTIGIEEEMRSSYLDYAMSVIVSRALPDVRDGLKPVQRRILYAMHDQGMRPGSSYKKCARLVGDVLGKYHPHGDSPVYEALVRMAQPFSMREPLVDGQGNFGSVDGDPPAAMRYTECKLSPITEYMLGDIDRETVDWQENFDQSLKEPTVLPARLPNLLVNGAAGIAVGMATNIPPHNVAEVCDAVVSLVRNPNANVEELMRHVKGPDFPTGAHIYGSEGIRNAYATGRGRIIVQATGEIEDVPRQDRKRIVYTEIPYQVNKSTLIQRIAELIKTRRVEGVSEVRDESDRRGMRIVLELRRSASPLIVMNNLYKHTSLRTSFSVNMIGLVKGAPRVLNLRQVLQYYIEFREEVIRRRAEFVGEAGQCSNGVFFGPGQYMGLGVGRRKQTGFARIAEESRGGVGADEHDVTHSLQHVHRLFDRVRDAIDRNPAPAARHARDLSGCFQHGTARVCDALRRDQALFAQ